MKHNKKGDCETESKKIAVLFPGIGYTCDKPLLYYTGKLCREQGYKVVPVPYGNFPKNVKGDASKMKQAFLSAADQAEEILKETEWTACEEIVFVGKSIGTAAAAGYAKNHSLSVRNILFTPLEETFHYTIDEGIAFHGTSDPWADTDEIRTACEKQDIPLFLTEHANHSLETGNVETDIKILQDTIERVRRFIMRQE